MKAALAVVENILLAAITTIPLQADGDTTLEVIEQEVVAAFAAFGEKVNALVASTDSKLDDTARAIISKGVAALSAKLTVVA